MNVTRLVAAYEFRSTVRRRSFWLMAFLFPLLVLTLSLGNTFMGDLGAGSLEDALTPSGPVAQGYVDQAGLIEELPPDVPPQALVSFASVGEAADALEQGVVSGYYIIPADHLTSGELVFVQEEFQPLSPAAGGPLMEYVLNYALTSDTAVAAALVDPTPRIDVASATGAAPPAAQGAASVISGMVPLAVLAILFFVIVMSSSYLLQSVTREKENRTAEVLLVSVRPRQLMLGKVLGLGAVALVQMGIWVGGSLLAVWQVAGIPDLASIGLSPGLLAWLLGFLVLGYVAYGSILAALGTLVPSQREGSQLMFVVLLPLMLPVWLNFTLIHDPNGSLPLALSLFPLSAPVAMTTRLVAGDVPIWQPVVALAGLALTAYLFVLLGARVFRAGTLLSSGSLSWGRIGHAVRGAFRR
jgi:ABC-2 type transport system permease protein